MIASGLRRGERGQARWQILRRVKVGKEGRKKLRVEQKANGRNFLIRPFRLLLARRVV
jgi:hypothetical protein